MSRIQAFIKKTDNSPFYLGVFNLFLSRMIPFNAPHGIRVQKISPGFVQTLLPYKRKNLNHVKSLHACALATLCEFTTGMTITSLLSETEYRIILKGIKMDYVYQGKTDVTAKFSIGTEFLNNEILSPLKTNDSVLVQLEIPVHNKSGEHICTGYITWQVKKWSKVKTKF